MMIYETLPSLDKSLNRLAKKDSHLYEQVLMKMEEIANSSDIEHYKNLKYRLKDRKSVHIGHFVLIFKFLKEENRIIFMDFDHHDNIYLK